MALGFDQGGGGKVDYGRLDDGTYVARVAQVIDLGRQHDTKYNPGTGKSEPLYYVVDENGDNVKKADGFSETSTEPSDQPVIKAKVKVTFETPTETMEYKGKEAPRWITKEYAISQQGALAKLAVVLNPEAKGASDIAGCACMVSVGSTSGGKEKVTSVNAPMKGIEVAELANPCAVFDLDAPDIAMFNGFYKYLQDTIKSNADFEGSALQRELGVPAPAANAAENSGVTPADDFDDDIPF